MDTQNPQAPTCLLNETFDIQRRLSNLRQYRADWDRENNHLDQMLQSIDETDPMDVQRGVQIETHRNIIRMMLTAEPIEIDTEVIDRVGYGVLFQRLAQQYATLSKINKKLWLQNLLFILTPELKRLYDKLNRVIDYMSYSQRRNLLLGGPARMGKTLSLSWLAFCRRPVVEAERNRIEVVMIIAPANRNARKPMLRQIITALGRVYHKSDNEDMLLDMVKVLCGKCGVKVLVVDEVENLSTRDMKLQLRDISNHLPRIPIIAASCKPYNFVLGEPELAGRFPDYVELAPYTGERLNEQLSFLELLLPFTKPSWLGIEEFDDGSKGPAAYIQEKTGGILEEIMLLIVDASLLAIDQNMPNLTMGILEQAAKRITETPTGHVLDLLMKERNDR